MIFSIHRTYRCGECSYCSIIDYCVCSVIVRIQNTWDDSFPEKSKGDIGNDEKASCFVFFVNKNQFKNLLL